MSCWKGMWRESLIPVLPSQRRPIRGRENLLANQSSTYIGLSFQLIFLSLQTSALLYMPIFLTICNITTAACRALSELWNSSSQEFPTWALNLHKGYQAEQELQRDVYDFIHLGAELFFCCPCTSRMVLGCKWNCMQRNRGNTKVTQSWINTATDCTEWPDRASSWLWFIMSREAVTWAIIHLFDCTVLFLPQWAFLC